MQMIQKGSFSIEAAERMHELLTAIEETGKGGSLTVTINVAPLQKGDTKTLTVSGVVSLKKPKIVPPQSVVYLNAGNIQRDDPQKAELPGLRRVDLEGASELRTVEQAPVRQVGGNA
jgi:hypothetical protein